MDQINKEDTISRQAAIDALFGLYEYQRDIDPTEAADLVRQGIYLAEKKIEQLQSAHPEIIRCKDCKYWREHKYAKETKRYIPFCGFNAIYTKADDFCSRAERRGEE